MTAAVVGIGAVSIHHPAPRMMWNGSTSAPIGFYRIDAITTPTRGDLVLVHPPGAARMMANERGYVPPGVPLVKRIVAAAGDLVCAEADRIAIKGVIVVEALVADGQGRPLTPWSGCRMLIAGEFFVLMTGVAASFDSRYFGPVDRADILGLAVPLWTW